MERQLPIWGGIECSINRVNDNYFDQFEASGHYERAGDIKAIASLGIKTLRYPILWERYQPTKETPIDWFFAKEKLGEIRLLGITPVIGLVHHGSGPAFVNFFDGSFEQGLADYATEFATAFPDIEYYTPVNEPLTTARFCGLYGHWYPHKKDSYSFCKILISECKATVMAMQAIKAINPVAKLVQTDDLGKTYSTNELAYQADFENERRWLGYDLIAGRVVPGHKMWRYIISAGIQECELHYFIDNCCPIDIMGVNYYVTSERYIDQHLHKYPAHTHGGNGYDTYADVEAVRVPGLQNTGFGNLLAEAWRRYATPLCITEVHMHCTREEQLRWFSEIYRASLTLKAQGVNIVGVTAWALFGAFGWDRLLTQPGGNYESGVFNLRNGELCRTALSALITNTNKGEVMRHPLTLQKGWWHSKARFLNAKKINSEAFLEENHDSPLLIIGGSGTLGTAFIRICEERNIPVVYPSRAILDITDDRQIGLALSRFNPWAIVNATGFVRVDDAEDASSACYEINTNGAIKIAAACAEKGIALVNFSSDLVFNGNKREAYVESDITDPINVYGSSKSESETGISSVHPASLIIRTSAFFGPWDKYNFAHQVLTSLRTDNIFKAADDILITPTYVPDLVDAVLDLLMDGQTGIWHLTNDGVVTWSELAKKICIAAKVDSKMIIPVASASLCLKATRPVNSALMSERGLVLPKLDNAIERYVSAMQRISLKENDNLLLYDRS